MCTNLTLSTEVHVGELWTLCDEPVDHLLPLFGADPSRAGDDRPIRRLLEAFTSEANVLVREDLYFDVDYRSEFSKTHEMSYAARSPDTTRFHFFSGRIPKSNRHLRDFVARADKYYGYTVIRPQSIGRVGRTIVSPDCKREELSPHSSLSEQVRTAVIEPVQVFGVPFLAVGVPFMEQDGHLLRCPHVAAWMCHYSAVLRGMVPRRPSAQFHGAVESTEAFGRPYPSEGLNTFALCATLRAVDLPPEALDADALGKARPMNWSDRAEFIKRIDSSQTGSLGARKLWVQENLTATICRYLNSAIPTIILRAPEETGEVGHAQVVVGYLRDVDVSSPAGKSASSGRSTMHSDVVAFIVSDDQIGPYEIVEVKDLVDEFVSPRGEESSLVVPLPRSVWLSGDSAERAAVEWIEALAKTHMAEQLTALLPRLTTTRRNVIESEVAAFCDRILRSGEEYAVRSYMTTGVDFKESISKRIGERLLIRAVGHMQLPKYIWVSEVIDRELRVSGRPFVRATVVLDATAVYIDGRSTYSDLPPLFVHLPGLAFVSPQFDLYDIGYDVGWFPTSADPYYTGRWHHRYNLNVQVGRHSKTASTSAR